MRDLVRLIVWTVVDLFVGKDGLWMEIGGVPPLLDIDGAIVVRNGDDCSEVISSDAPKLALWSDVGVLQLEFVTMDGCLGRATSLLQKRQSGETGTFVEQILGGKPKKASGQREMLMAISGKGEGKSKGAVRRRSARPVSARLGSSA